MHVELLWGLGSVVLVSLISLIGIITIPFKQKNINYLLPLFVSFAAGALIADAFIHLLPEAAEEMGFTPLLSLYVLSGILFSFLIEKFLWWRHCHEHDCKSHTIKPVGILNLVGESVHNFLDGIIIGASYMINVPTGIATTVAVIFHEIPQEIGDFAILLHSGFKRAKALLANFLVALTAVLGLFAVILLSHVVEHVTVFLVPFAAGHFIYISAADLIPELHKETRLKQSLLQLLVFLAGIGVMLLLILLE